MSQLIVVTGASGGIGAEISSRLASDGFEVLAQYRSNKERAEQLQRELDEAGGSSHLIQADLSHSDGIEAVVDAVRGLLRCDDSLVLRALVNNAARLLGPSLAEATPGLFEEYVSLNLKAPFFLTQQLAMLMTPGSSVVNISSASAHIASAGDIVYALTKAALESFTRNAAEALAPRGVRVNGVIPGFTNNGHPAFADEGALVYMGSMSVLGGVAEPHHVAAAVSYLVSDEAARTTGSLIDVTGGMTLHPRPQRVGSIKDIL